MYKLQNIKQPTNAKVADMVIYNNKIIQYNKSTQSSLQYTVTFVGGCVTAPYSVYVTEQAVGELAIGWTTLIRTYKDETESGVTFDGLPVKILDRPGNVIVLCGAYKCINVKSFKTSK